MAINKHNPILILGATGLTGRLIAAELVKNGYTQIVVLVRNLQHPHVANLKELGVEIAHGDARNVLILHRIVPKVDTVINALGSRNLLRPHESEVTRYILAELNNNPQKRYLTISSMGVADSWSKLKFATKVLYSIFLGQILRDKAKMEASIKQSKVKWIVVRPGILDNKMSGNVKLAVAPSNLLGRVSRQVVAENIVKMLEGNEYWGKIVEVVQS